ncbi:hypothetical protein THMIRHAM_17490 [Thiomicrorhabdus immobilis]|uniref:Flp pilus-assembly TadG-like N-terminal domain-containing protein n=1 Tax=Thiomicrorhabdus immobilis TaxID=2791037 RepID=A0ABM7MEU1_9GAMM|nr:hypothetical protein [Thiomicrorhabdus immobilis]BCN93964.1 hypothetical protein THMIRHAM_17490 [Thiomicrorhabdus immobilis]
MSNDSVLQKQRGSISLLGALSIATALSGVFTVMELGNKMIMERNFNNYAQALAPVALRTELALTEDNIATEGDKVREVIGDFLSKLGHTLDGDVSLNITFGNMKTVPAYSYTDPKTNLTYTITEEFEPLTEYESNPRSGQDADGKPIQFSAVALELVESSPTGLLGFHPKGQAIYGISEEDANSTDMADCFCDKRYDMCLSADMSAVPATFPGNIGAPGSVDRQNYCEYGYVESHPGNVDKTKYPSVELSSQWLGKVEEGSTELVDINDSSQMDNYDIVAAQQPLEVVSGVNPFPTKTWNFWSLLWGTSSADYYVKNWDGSTLEKNDSYDNGFETTGDYLYHKVALFGFLLPQDKEVYVDGYFYVGRTGVCVDGTDATDVPNITGALADMTDGPKNSTDAEVQRCLSYETTLGSTSSTTDVTTCMFFGCCCTTTSVTTTTNIDGYAQQSCKDFNRTPSTRLNFFQWMMSLFFSPFIDWQTSYQQLDCGVKKMKTYPTFSWLFWR